MANTIDLATYVAKVEVDTTGLKTGLNEADSNVKGQVGGLADWSKLKMTGLMAGIGVMTAKLAKESIDSFATVQEEMNKVFTLLPPMSEKAMSDMTQDARDLALEMGKLPDEIIPAVYSALSAGVPQDNVFDYVETAAKMAVAGGAETETAVEGLAAVINAYNLDATEADKISDMFFVTLKNGMTSVDELSHSLSNVTPIAAAMGIEFEEVAGALATMTAQGIPTATATNQIKAMLSELNKEGSVSSDIFKEIAGESFPDFIKNGGELNEALAMMDDYAEETNTTISNLFGSVNAGQGALALTGENMESFTEDIASMKDSAGATDEAFEKMNQGINRSKEVIQATVEYIKGEIGQMLAPLLSAFYAAVMVALKALIPAVEAIAEVVGWVVDIVRDRIDYIKERIETFAEENQELLDSIATTVKSITDKIGKIIKKVLDFIGDILDTFHRGAEDGVNTTWQAIAEIIDSVLQFIEGILDIFIAVFEGDWDGLWEAVANIATLAWDGIKALIDGALKAIVGILKGMFGAFKSVGKELFNKVWDAAKEIMGSLISWLPNKIQELIGKFTGAYGEARASGKGMFQSVWDGMKSIWGSIFSWVTDKVSWLTNKLAFWRRGKNEMDDGGSGGSKRGGAGSYATGARLIKKDGYNLLHAGEAVIPADLNPFNPKNVSKGGFYNEKFGGGSGGGDTTYDVSINIDKVESGVDIEKAVERGIDKAERKRSSRLKKRGI